MSTIEEAREQAREALIETVARAVREDHARFCDGCSFTLGQFRRAAEVALDALGVEGPRPITDEMMTAAAEALRPGLFTGSLAQYERRYDNYGADVRAAHQELVLEDVRAALEAAEGARR